MKKIMTAAVMTAMICGSIFAAGNSRADSASTEKLNTARIPFVLNQGQMAPDVLAYAQTFAGRVSVMRDSSWIYSLPRYAEASNAEMVPALMPMGLAAETKAPEIESWTVLKESLVGAKISTPVTAGESAAHVSYFIGSNSAQWKQGLKAWRSMNMGEVYQGISLVLVAHGNNVEKIFTVNPGANPADIKLTVDGGIGMYIGNNGELVVKTSQGPVSFTAPVAYQETPQGRAAVKISYRINYTEQNYGFSLGQYDKTIPLIIDPLIASTYIGGTGSDGGRSVIETANGDIVVAGFSYSSDYPTIAGVHQAANSGGCDIVVSRFNADLSTLIASTYIGGIGSDEARSVIEAANGDIIVAGFTYSANYPAVTGGCQMSNAGGCDVVVSRLNSSLSTLIASTYIGGSRSDYGYSMFEAANGDIVVGGYCSSTNYPATAGSYQTSNAGDYDIVVSRLNSSLSSMVASTYIGGSGFDNGNSIVEAGNGDVIVTGYAISADYPVKGGFQMSNAGGYDMVVSRLNSTLSTMIASTYIGGGGLDNGNSVIEAANGDIVVAGVSSSANYPVTAGAYQSSNAGVHDVVVSRLNSSLSVMTASTFIGGGDEDYGNSVTEDSGGHIIVAGRSSSTNYPVTAGATQTQNAGSFDMIVSSLSATLSSLTASTCLGGSLGEYGFSSVVSTNGDIIVAGYSYSTNYPVTSGAFQTTNAGNADVVITRISGSLRKNSGSTLNDFDGDGKSDIAIFRPASQLWVAKRSSDGSVIKRKFGIRGDIPVPADYDGDMKTDIAVFRPSAGRWFGLLSGGGMLRTKWGVPNDVAVPGDYDGDDISDLAIFRPSTQFWVVKRSSDGSVVKRKFGIRGDIPVPADYDGDMKTDIAVFRPSAGRWFSLLSGGGMLRTKWGVPNDVAVPGDYDGDGICDLAIFRPSTRLWVVKHSSDGSVFKRKWGIAGDIPVPGDYDGDGKTDLCIFRPSSRYWVILKSSDGLVIKRKWGIAGDEPVSVQYQINKQMH